MEKNEIIEARAHHNAIHMKANIVRTYISVYPNKDENKRRRLDEKNTDRHHLAVTK